MVRKTFSGGATSVGVLQWRKEMGLHSEYNKDRQFVTKDQGDGQ